jgi:hypothetical protein
MALAFEGDRIRIQWRMAWIVAPRRQAGERGQLCQDEPVSRAELAYFVEKLKNIPDGDAFWIMS